MNGLVAAKGREAGIPTPFNDEITRMVVQIEKGEMTFGPEHLKKLEGLVSSKASRRQELRRNQRAQNRTGAMHCRNENKTSRPIPKLVYSLPPLVYQGSAFSRADSVRL